MRLAASGPFPRVHARIDRPEPRFCLAHVARPRPGTGQLVPLPFHFDLGCQVREPVQQIVVSLVCGHGAHARHDCVEEDFGLEEIPQRAGDGFPLFEAGVQDEHQDGDDGEKVRPVYDGEVEERGGRLGEDGFEVVFDADGHVGEEPGLDVFAVLEDERRDGDCGRLHVWVGSDACEFVDQAF